MPVNAGMRGASGDDRPAILCLVSLPPPVTGRTVATARFLERLGRFVGLRVNNLSGGRGASVSGRLLKVLNSMAWVIRLAFGESRRFDHVYVVANHGSGLWFDIAYAGLARLWGTPVIVHHHVFSYFNERKSRVALLFRLTGRGCRHLLLCDRMRTGCEALYSTKAELLVLPNFGSDAAETSAASPNASKSSLEIVFVSNLTREKGIDDVLELARRFSAREHVVFRLAGPAMSEGIRKSIERCCGECGGALEWLGPVDGEARTRLLSSADLFLFPTRYHNEAQPLVLIEALEAGVPVVANARGCIAEMIGEASELLVNDESDFVETAAGLIERMLGDSNYRDEVRGLAPKRAAALAGRAGRALEHFAAQL